MDEMTLGQAEEILENYEDRVHDLAPGTSGFGDDGTPQHEVEGLTASLIIEARRVVEEQEQRNAS